MKKTNYLVAQELFSKLFKNEFFNIVEYAFDNLNINDTVCIYYDFIDNRLMLEFSDTLSTDSDFSVFLYRDNVDCNLINMTLNSVNGYSDFLYDVNLNFVLTMLLNEASLSVFNKFLKMKEFIDSESEDFYFVKSFFALLSKSKNLQAKEKYLLLEAFGFEEVYLGTSDSVHNHAHEILTLYNIKTRKYFRGNCISYGIWNRRSGSYTYYRAYIQKFNI